MILYLTEDELIEKYNDKDNYDIIQAQIVY